MPANRFCVVPAFAFVLAACGQGRPSTPQTTAPAQPRTERSARAADNERFDRVRSDGERETAKGVTIFAPKGWYWSGRSQSWTLEDPEREATVTLVEVEAETNDQAVAVAWRQLGKAALTKIDQTTTHQDVSGWDELTETTWETPAAEARVVAMSIRRKGNRAFVFYIEGKLAALARRGAQVRQIVGGISVPGVEDEDLSQKLVLPLEGERARAFEAFVERARTKTHVPGMSVAVVHDGRVVFEKGFGTKKLGTKAPIDPQTKFMIGSVTKSLSSMLIAKLVDEGKVKWDTPVKELLPTFQTGDATFTEKLTMWHTFCGCTGMPRKDLDFIFEYAKEKPESVFSWFTKEKPTTGIGETYQYSNQMTAVGGFLAARIAEPTKPLTTAYATAMKNRLFAPMHMANTTASFDEGRRGNVASPHGWTMTTTYGDAVPLPFTMESFVVPIAPAGAVFSTAHDMAEYALVELAEGKSTEGKEVVSATNLLARRTPRVKASAKVSYGLGLADARMLGLRIVTHDGGTFGFVSRFLLAPDKKVGLVVLTNSTASGATLVDAVTQRLFELMFGAKEHATDDIDKTVATAQAEFAKSAKKMLQDPVPEAIAARLAGTWRTDRLGTLSIARDRTGRRHMRADAGEWSTRLGYAKEEDGTEKLFLLDPPLAGMHLRLDGDAMVIEAGQDVFRFVKP